MSKLMMILLVQLLFVPMLTLRTICMVKNLKILTAIFGFLEAMVYIFGLAIVLSGEQNYLEMLVYSVGFSIGLLIGILVEQKLAIGYTSYHVNIRGLNEALIQILRNEGYGVTAFNGVGKSGVRVKLEILTRRKRQRHLFKLIYSIEPDAFIISYEPKMFKGGFLTTLMKKRMSGRTIKSQNDHESSLVDKTVKEIKSEMKILKKSWKS